jgi:hypothetical protein
MRQRSILPMFLLWTDHLLAWLDRRTEDMITGISGLTGLKVQDDPEAIFQEAWLFCDAGDLERGLMLIRRAVEKSYFVAPTLSNRPQFDALRNEPAFREVLALAEAGQKRALAAFREGGGERLLGRRFG